MTHYYKVKKRTKFLLLAVCLVVAAAAPTCTNTMPGIDTGTVSDK